MNTGDPIYDSCKCACSCRGRWCVAPIVTAPPIENGTTVSWGWNSTGAWVQIERVHYANAKLAEIFGDVTGVADYAIRSMGDTVSALKKKQNGRPPRLEPQRYGADGRRKK